MIRDYLSLEKTYWRNYVWNSLGRRVGHKQSAICLYLIGPQDLDRQTAVRKGFRNENLIGVDLLAEPVYNCRKNGGLAIQADICSVLTHWPQDWPLRGIVLDLKGGLNTLVNTICLSLFVSRAVQYGKTQICINLQRGRDAESNPVRSGIDKITEKYSAKKELLPKDSWEIFTDKVHRGKQFFVHFTTHLWRSIDENTKQKINFLKLCMDGMKPQFHSYRQTRFTPYMDSIIFTFPIGTTTDYNWAYGVWKEVYGPLRDNIKGKIAALRAVRTMKYGHG